MSNEAFEVWAKDHLGRGYSLEKDEGVYINPVTRWAAKAYHAATERAAKKVEEVGPKDGALALVTAGFAAAIRGAAGGGQ